MCVNFFISTSSKLNLQDFNQDDVYFHPIKPMQYLSHLHYHKQYRVAVGGFDYCSCALPMVDNSLAKKHGLGFIFGEMVEKLDDNEKKYQKCVCHVIDCLVKNGDRVDSLPVWIGEESHQPDNSVLITDKEFYSNGFVFFENVRFDYRW